MTGKSRNDILVEDRNAREYFTERFAEAGGLSGDGLVFGGVYVRCDFTTMTSPFTPAEGALFYACAGIENNATREQILALHPNATV